MVWWGGGGEGNVCFTFEVMARFSCVLLCWGRGGGGYGYFLFLDKSGAVHLANELQCQLCA